MPHLVIRADDEVGWSNVHGSYVFRLVMCCFLIPRAGVNKEGNSEIEISQ